MEELRQKLIADQLKAKEYGIILGLEAALMSLNAFLEQKVNKYNGSETISKNELNLFMNTTINLYKKDFNIDSNGI